MNDEYGIFFDFEGVTMRLPINPSEFNIKSKSNNKNYELVNLGEIQILKSLPLRELSFKFLLPDSPDYPFVVTKNNFKYPTYYVDRFRYIRESKKPIRFVVIRQGSETESNFNTNILVSIDELTATEEAGALGWWEINITLKEYREFTSKKIKLQTNTTTGATESVVEEQRASDKTAPSTYTVKSGDTLWAIAQSLLGDGSRYTEIAALNSLQNANLISIGQELKIPGL